MGLAAICMFGGITPSTPAPDPAPTLESMTPAAAADSSCWNYKSAERGFTKKMNAARSNNDKVTLKLDPELSKVARKHTGEMVNKDLLHHTPSSTLANRVTAWNTLGENVGVGSTVDSLHKAFMNSTAHKANILHSSFRYVGVGTKSAGNRLWVTVIFEASSNPGTTLDMPNC
jgi:uncharacterized protein YkwD